MSTTVSDLDGNFKDQFHSKVEELVPQVAILQRDNIIDFVPSDKMNGEFYSIPTLLRSNQGVTYVGEGGGISTLEAAITGVMKEAQVKGSEMVVRGQIGYKALSQAASAGPRAFKKASAWLVEDLLNVAHTRIEIAALYGRSGLGVVESATANGSDCDLLIKEAEFAPGVWAPLEGATIDAWTGDSKNNASGVLTIKGINTVDRKITVSFTGTLASEMAADDVLFFVGAKNGATLNEMCGLHKQLNDTTGTLFNLNRSTYSLIRGNVKDLAGPISKAKIVEAAMLAVDKGNLKNMLCLIGTKAWAVLAADDMALRSFDGSYSSAKSKSGSKELEYEFVGGTITVKCHPMVKYGHAMLFSPEDVLWVGSSKPTFEIPGMSEKFFRLVADKNAVELQNFSDLAIYVLKPAQTVLIKGLTY